MPRGTGPRGSRWRCARAARSARARRRPAARRLLRRCRRRSGVRSRDPPRRHRLAFPTLCRATITQWVGFANLLCDASSVTPADRAPHPRRCSVAAALDVVGEKWSLLVVRELFLGSRRFSEIAANTGAPRDILTTRLRRLEEVGVVAR